MKRKYKSFFHNKKCTYCGKKADRFRLIQNRHEMLCDSKECDRKSRIKAGYFGIGNITKK